MKVLFIVLVFLISLDLMALSNERSINSNTNLKENTSNKISIMENVEPYTRSINANYAIKPGEKLNVYNLNGSIKFIGWNKNYVKITAVKKVFRNSCDLDCIQMTLSTLNGLIIETINISNDDRARIDYIINVPKNTIIGDILSNGNIQYENLPNKVLSNIRRLSNR